MRTLGGTIDSSDLADFLESSKERYRQGFRSFGAVLREFENSSVSDLVDAINADPASFEARVLPKMGLSVRHIG